MRKEFGAKVRKAVFNRAAGHCEKCKAALKTSEGELDHVLPDALGGEPVAANAMLLCRVCHVEKTGGDVKKIRKADRQRNNHTGAAQPKGKLKSAGFPAKAKAAKIQPPERRSLYAPALWPAGNAKGDGHG